MLKKYFKDRLFRIWLSVTCALLAFMIVAGTVAGTALYDVIKSVLGREIAVYDDGYDAKFVAKTNSKKDAFKNANEVNEEICEEGYVLLKNANDALPLNERAKISVFGKNSVNLVYGGSGSGGGNNNGKVGLYDSLREEGFIVNDTLEKFYKDNTRSGAPRPENSKDLDSGADVDIITGETPASSYNDGVKSSYQNFNDAAIVVLSRIGGEGFDLPRQSADDSKRHYLELDPNEADLIKHVTSAGFGKVIIVINSAAVMELGWLESGVYGTVDACLWIGAPGNSGINALGRILNGKVNPSGRTVDTWAADLLAAPAAVNFGTNGEKDGDAYLVYDSDDKEYYAEGYFVSYEEGIYVGYRYYETRGFTDGEEWYKESVVYPFGYGLSYSDFSCEIVDKDKLGDKLVPTEKISLSIKATNISAEKIAGKEVVQVYVTAPYYGGVEKAHKVLCGFAKTEELEKGKSETVTIEIDPYSFASYDHEGKVIDGYKGYLLEHGDYVFTLGSDAHNAIDTFTLNLTEDYKFEKDGKTQTTVTNVFDKTDSNGGIDDELETVLSRSDWEGTWPQKPAYESRIKDKAFIDSISGTKHNNPETFDKPVVTGAPVTVTMFDLVYSEDYKGYDDERWEAILDSLTVDDMVKLVGRGAFNTQPISKIEKNQTTDADGPAGFTIFMGEDTIYLTCAYASEVVMASTWNVDLIYKLGQSVGEEGLWGNAQGDGTPYSGWYAPAANIHRTAFGGRNFEYFSEDGFISGVMAAAEIKGAASKGVYCYMKHFVANDQETHRSLTGLCTWLNEQSLREIYLKPFEIAVKDGEATGIMSSFNRLGGTWAGGDYRLLTTVLRDEWGFKGTVICDFNTNRYMNPKQMIYAGGDLNLSTLADRRWQNVDANSNADLTVLRRASKNILYTVSLSNSMNAKAKYYLLPAWLITAIVIMVVISIGLAVWGVFVILGAKKRVNALTVSETADGQKEAAVADGANGNE